MGAAAEAASAAVALVLRANSQRLSFMVSSRCISPEHAIYLSVYQSERNWESAISCGFFPHANEDDKPLCSISQYKQ